MQDNLQSRDGLRKAEVNYISSDSLCVCLQEEDFSCRHTRAEKRMCKVNPVLFVEYLLRLRCLSPLPFFTFERCWRMRWPFVSRTISLSPSLLSMFSATEAPFDRKDARLSLRRSSWRPPLLTPSVHSPLTLCVTSLQRREQRNVRGNQSENLIRGQGM